MIIVYHFFRAALSVATHPGEFGRLVRGESDIVAQRRNEMNEVVQFALKTLRENSPVGSGRDPHPGLYRDSHTLFINGDDVKDLSSWQPGDEIEISNSVPYARILEVGDSRHRIPHHTYELTEQAVQRKYGDIVRVEFTYMPIRFAQSGGPVSRRRRGANRLDRQPTLIIKGLD